MVPFDLPGVMRRVRRSADLSQREMAERVGLSKTTVAAIESGERGLDARILAVAARLSGLRLALLDAEDREVAPMADDAVRDMGYRRFPAHLDTRHGDEDWWHGPERYSRAQPWYTFDLRRTRRDGRRRQDGTPADHRTPRPGDSPRERSAARAREAGRMRAEELERRRERGDLPPPLDVTCTCPPECEQLDQGARPVHIPDCPCGCDLD